MLRTTCPTQKSRGDNELGTEFDKKDNENWELKSLKEQITRKHWSGTQYRRLKSKKIQSNHGENANIRGGSGGGCDRDWRWIWNCNSAQKGAREGRGGATNSSILEFFKVEARQGRRKVIQPQKPPQKLGKFRQGNNTWTFNDESEGRGGATLWLKWARSVRLAFNGLLLRVCLQGIR